MQSLQCLSMFYNYSGRNMYWGWYPKCHRKEPIFNASNVKQQNLDIQTAGSLHSQASHLFQQVYGWHILYNQSYIIIDHSVLYNNIQCFIKNKHSYYYRVTGGIASSWNHRSTRCCYIETIKLQKNNNFKTFLVCVCKA